MNDDWTDEQKEAVIDAHKAGRIARCPDCKSPLLARTIQFQPEHEGGLDEEVSLSCPPCGSPSASYRRLTK